MVEPAVTAITLGAGLIATAVTTEAIGTVATIGLIAFGAVTIAAGLAVAGIVGYSLAQDE